MAATQTAPEKTKKLSKKAKEKLWAEDEARAHAEWEAYFALRDRCAGKKLQAQISWFDASSGEGMVRVAATDFSPEMNLYLHFSAIEGISKNNYAWPAEADLPKLRELEAGGVPCLVSIYFSSPGNTMIASAEALQLLQPQPKPYQHDKYLTEEENVAHYCDDLDRLQT